MLSKTNRQFRLVNRPIGEINDSNLEFREEAINAPKDGEVLVRNIYLSLDPTNRIWMSDMPQYMPPVELGEVMRGLTIGVVEDSKHPNFKQGDLVSGLLGWQDYAIVGGESINFLSKIPANLPVPISAFLGVLGLTGCTAYFGLLDIGKPQAGETVVVSAAAGAVGSIVGQIAKIKGCRVVGIAGSDEKCNWLKELGFDAVINYKTTDINQALEQACPNGIDVYFDNVGGAILDAVLTKINLYARIVICGLISVYNAKEPVPGPYNFGQILMKRAKVQGFIVSDYAQQWAKAVTEIAQWIQEGKIKYAEDIVEGLENAPQTLKKLFDGTNQGKLIIKVSEYP